MQKLNYQLQKANEPWTDESGIPIPFDRISKMEKLKERLSGKILKRAIKINEALNEFKAEIDSALQSISEALIEENKLPKNTKGNFTWYNFDRSIKIEVNVNETIRFDDALIAAAREQLDDFISRNVTGTDELIRELINSAFQNTKGGLDSKKVMSLMKYRTRIKDAAFQKALDLIQKSISNPSSKKYFRVWVKDENGQYQNIDLNFSSI
ncbi:MAG: DUF3164 family protein [Verrucomicrobia bacterium]|nr:DUF3164 family protein [Verrucomicrobiota bacterium]